MEGDKLASIWRLRSFATASRRFWELVERADETVYVRLFAPDDREYLAQLWCEKYGDEPIEGKFVHQRHGHVSISVADRKSHFRTVGQVQIS